jgi:hypothetical protein
MRGGAHDMSWMNPLVQFVVCNGIEKCNNKEGRKREGKSIAITFRGRMSRGGGSQETLWWGECKMRRPHTHRHCGLHFGHAPSAAMEHPRPDALSSSSSTPVPALPVELWSMVLAFLRPHEEYQAAVVCRDWYAITVRRREKRGEKTWRTWVGVFCNTVPRLQWARESDCPWCQGMCSAAAGGGHLEVLQWARANCPWDVRTCSAAAKGGHLEVLQWAHANGCPWSKKTCSSAAWGGHLEVLQWARSNGCPWDERTCSDAAKGGHLEVLQWARANGCHWNTLTCK